MNKDLTPKAIVAALDTHIIGQDAAKRAVAVALRNRWRRQHRDGVPFKDTHDALAALMQRHGSITY